MGSSFNDPFSTSSSFIDLLNSQQEINTPESETHSPTNQRESRHRWSVPEENALVSAWLNTSKDGIVGNDQRGGTFWNRVAAYYAASPVVFNLVIRENNTCKQKWSKMNESMSKFVGCYNYASRHRISGQSDDDVMEFTYKLYFQDRKVKFSLEHVWRSLRNDQKWCSMTTPDRSNKRTKLHDTMTNSSSSNTASHVEEETMERPIGVKAAKEKGKKKGKGKLEESEKSSLNELTEMWKIKEKDLAAKERLSRQKILDNLMLITEPLTEK